jgi:hypothetical protein
MRSTKSMVLLSFGILFLSFGAVMVLLDFLGIHFGARESWSTGSGVAVVFLVLGVIFYGSGFRMGKSDNSAQ